MEQKNEIASSELEEVSKEVEETKRSSEKLIDTLKAVLEETDVRIAELKKDAYEFKRDIVVGAENFRTGKTMAVRDFSLSFSSLLFPPFPSPWSLPTFNQ